MDINEFDKLKCELEYKRQVEKLRTKVYLELEVCESLPMYQELLALREEIKELENKIY